MIILGHIVPTALLFNIYLQGLIKIYTVFFIIYYIYFHIFVFYMWG